MTLDTPNPKEDYEASRANATLVLASCMQGLAKEPSQEWAYHVDLTSWTRKMVEIWGWNETVLSGLVNVIAAQYVLPAYSTRVTVVSDYFFVGPPP